MPKKTKIFIKSSQYLNKIDLCLRMHNAWGVNFAKF